MIEAYFGISVGGEEVRRIKLSPVIKLLLTALRDNDFDEDRAMQAVLRAFDRHKADV